jgi:hypothetical protein
VNRDDDLGQIGQRRGGIVDHRDHHRAAHLGVLSGGQQIRAAARLRDGDQRHIAKMLRGGLIERADRGGMADGGQADSGFEQEFGETGGLVGAARASVAAKGGARSRRRLPACRIRPALRRSWARHSAGASRASDAIFVATVGAMEIMV